MNNQFLGFVELADTLVAAIPIENSSGAPKDPTSAPSYRIYGEGALIANGTGSLSKLDTFVVTGATNVSPIVITTSAAHGLKTGNRVVIADVGGNTAANGEFAVTYVSDTSFSLQGSTGNGAYTSGGVGHVAGLYLLSHEIASGDGFGAGKMYSVWVNFEVSSASYADCHSFLVT